MNTVFFSQEIWPELTKSVRSCRHRCSVAVAYFGKDASKLLPLPKGSHLVVDASEGAVKSGQTCPTDLLAMIKRGVQVYSVANLHAKVFVLGRAAYIGSANVSRHSAGTLIEAAVRITDPTSVKAAKDFVAAHCLHKQTPEQLKQLARLYRPPKFSGGKNTKRLRVSKKLSPALPRLLIARLQPKDLSDQEQELHDTGWFVAEKRQKHSRGYEMDSFEWTGKCIFKKGDVIVQVTNEGAGRILVSPPANFLYKERGIADGKRTTFVYVEGPSLRRRQLSSLSRKLGRGSRKHLLRNGIIKSSLFAQSLLKIWNA